MTTEAGTRSAPTYIRRFDGFDRFLHYLMMVAFFGLALSGLPLLFSLHRWAAVLARLLGGFHSAGVIHRISAAGMLACFAMHLWRVAYRVAAKRDWGVLWGPRSMVPRPKDAVDIYQNFRWFFRLGPRPKFDRYAYWEKFDYWAVFWGMAIIGGSGLVLWFPKLFAHILPGTVFNLALLIHGEEALLAVSFIFTIHFFNSHLRPEKFPVDRVIFTGTVPEEELRHERPAEYERLLANGDLARLAAPPPTSAEIRSARVTAVVALLLGLVLISLTAYALIM